MDKIDLRSDTVTHPTPAMRAAMAAAEVGDDVFGDDPTVNRLQEMAARLVGKEAALFVPSGTMGNLAAVLAHCARGEEVILGDKAHTYLFEAGGVAALGGVHPHPIPNQADGTLALAEVEAAIRPDDPHFPRTRLICLENTHNLCGGAPLTPEYTRQVGELARQHGLRLHIDGARIFNAAVAGEVDVQALTGPADSVTFCLSKGLCAPVGSLLCGRAEFIYHARRARKILGGGMRQAGVLAAAGLVALETMIERLADDHANARRLAEGLRRLPQVDLAPDAPRTNLLFFGLRPECTLDAPTVAARLAAGGVLILARGPRNFRAVTHNWVTAENVDAAVEAFREVLHES